jgi:hypothetical protein
MKPKFILALCVLVFSTLAVLYFYKNTIRQAPEDIVHQKIEDHKEDNKTEDIVKKEEDAPIEVVLEDNEKLKNSEPKNIKPIQIRDLEKFPLASMYYQHILKESEATRQRLLKSANIIAHKYVNAKAVVPELKGFERTKEKVDTDYNGDWKKITDIVRGSISFANFEDLELAINDLEQDFQLVHVKDRFKEPTETGYMAYYINFRDKNNGIIGEMQFVICHLEAENKNQHKDYELVRSIKAEAKKQMRNITEEEQQIITDAINKSKSIYTEAYQKALHKEACPNGY